MDQPGVEYISGDMDEQLEMPLLAVIVRAGKAGCGTEWLTGRLCSAQLALMHRPKGSEVVAHQHIPCARQVKHTWELMVVRYGRVCVDLYDERGRRIAEKELGPGDTLLLLGGGHGFTFPEETELIYVKQGPYAGDRDKERIHARRA